ncbi:hypothetical protein SCG7109_AK_00240 [Chlamydiales bacterium SCGC AG-110-M15]|nr:hypothetical protein SCG7109_AK_00240 [Chlamydiales bacterium SCGC AG-110-M15]
MSLSATNPSITKSISHTIKHNKMLTAGVILNVISVIANRVMANNDYITSKPAYNADSQLVFCIIAASALAICLLILGVKAYKHHQRTNKKKYVTM